MKQRFVLPFLLALALLSGGCAAVFRSSSPKVRVESDPAGADVEGGGKTPTEITASRGKTTNVTVKKDGYASHYGAVKRSINPLWLVWDIGTCVFPVTLCIPVVVDAITGAWYDVEDVHRVTLETGGAAGTASATPPSSGTPIGTAAPSGSAPPKIEMSDNDRKAAARAAYLEGVELQEKGKHADALQRFRAAQRLVEAPTHLLRIAQCLTATNKLLDAQETYETLVRLELAAGAPEAFKTAQEQGKKDLEKIKPRVPTLRLAVSPAQPPGLVIQLNGNPMPNELVGIARPLNPGTYRITGTATGFKTPAPIEVDLKEGASPSVTLKFEK